MKIAVIGATGAIGAAFIKTLKDRYEHCEIHAFSSKLVDVQQPSMTHYKMDYNDEASIKKAAQASYNNQCYDLIILATGLLHGGEDLQPEKALRDLSAEKFQKLFAANTIFPAIAAKHFLPLLRKDNRSIFACLSARVGSISDNALGGWYSYRASKAALNMIIKNAAIEMGRRHKEMLIVGLHPGTVDSALSEPFQSQVKEGKLFTPTYSAEKLISVLENLTAKDSGKCFAWDGQEVLP